MNHFVPLTTFQGLTPAELKLLLNGKKLILWGCGHLGRSLLRIFEKNEFEVEAFCDSNLNTQKSGFAGYRVLSPQAAVEFAQKQKSFIIIASARFRQEIEKQCKENGLAPRENFLSYLSVSRPEAAIDIASTFPEEDGSRIGPLFNYSNLKPSSMMSFSDYGLVLEKLIKEIPHLLNIDIGTWSEPLFNLEIAEIIKLTEKHLSCTINTSLQLSEGVDTLAESSPSQIIIFAAGIEETYEENHSGASWENFKKNLLNLSERFKGSSDTQISIAYQLYRNNQGKDLQAMMDLSKKLGFRFYKAWSYLNPYDRLLRYINTGSLSKNDERTLNALPWKLETALGLANRDQNKPCLCQRIFPVINSDLSVALCHVYSEPTVASSFLTSDLDELLKKRHSNEHCVRCQSACLHRLDIEVLLRKNQDSHDLIKGASEC